MAVCRFTVSLIGEYFSDSINDAKVAVFPPIYTSENSVFFKTAKAFFFWLVAWPRNHPCAISPCLVVNAQHSKKRDGPIVIWTCPVFSCYSFARSGIYSGPCFCDLVQCHFHLQFSFFDFRTIDFVAFFNVVVGLPTCTLFSRHNLDSLVFCQIASSVFAETVKDVFSPFVLVQRQQEFLLSGLTDKKGGSSTSFKH